MKRRLKSLPRSFWGYGGILLLLHVGMLVALWMWLGSEVQNALLRVRFSGTGQEQLIVAAYHVFWYPFISFGIVMGNMALAVALRGRKRYDLAVRAFWYHWLALSSVWISLLGILYLAVIMTKNTL